MGRAKTEKNNPGIFILLFIIITFIASCTRDNPVEPPRSSASVADLMAAMSIQHTAKSVIAPDFELLSVSGEKVSLGQHRGKVVLLNFWASW